MIRIEQATCDVGAERIGEHGTGASGRSDRSSDATRPNLSQCARLRGRGCLSNLHSLVLAPSAPQARWRRQRPRSPGTTAAVVVPLAAKQPRPRIFVDPPLAEPLARGVVVLQYRTENIRIVPVFGQAALQVSPRIGHLHVTMDNLPWDWADARGVPVIIQNLPAGPHRVLIELADANHGSWLSLSCRGVGMRSVLGVQSGSPAASVYSPGVMQLFRV